MQWFILVPIVLEEFACPRQMFFFKLWIRLNSPWLIEIRRVHFTFIVQTAWLDSKQLTWQQAVILAPTQWNSNRKHILNTHFI